MVRLQRRGLVTVPHETCQQLHLKEGQTFMMRVVDDRHLIIEIMQALSPDDLFSQYPIADLIIDDLQPTTANEAVVHHKKSEVTPLREGYVGTDVFLQAQAHEDQTPTCRSRLRAAAEWQIILHIDPIVFQELTHMLPRYIKTMTRSDISLYCRSVLQWSGVRMDDTPFWLSVLETWEADERLGWAEAVLIRRSQESGRALWIWNRLDFDRHALPDNPWPDTTESLRRNEVDDPET